MTNENQPQSIEQPPGPPEVKPKSRLKLVLIVLLAICILLSPLGYLLAYNYLGYGISRVYKKYDFADGACEWLVDVLPANMVITGLLRDAQYEDLQHCYVRFRQVVNNADVDVMMKPLYKTTDWHLKYNCGLTLTYLYYSGDVDEKSYFKYAPDIGQMAIDVYGKINEADYGTYFMLLGEARNIDNILDDSSHPEHSILYLYSGYEKGILSPNEEKMIDDILIGTLDHKSYGVQYLGICSIVRGGLVDQVEDKLLEMIDFENPNWHSFAHALTEQGNKQNELALKLLDHFNDLPEEDQCSVFSPLPRLLGKVKPEIANQIISSYITLIRDEEWAYKRFVFDIFVNCGGFPPQIYEALGDPVKQPFVAEILAPFMVGNNKAIPELLKVHKGGGRTTKYFAADLLLKINTAQSKQALKEQLNIEEDNLDAEMEEFIKKLDNERNITFGPRP